MEEFKPEDGWAITKLVQLSNGPKKKREQYDNNTRHRMLSQWDWWRTNYIDEASDRPRHAVLGPTRKLLDVINGDALMQHTSTEEIRLASFRAEQHMVLSRYRHENMRAHQLALTNAATSNRMLQSTNSNTFLVNEMSRMTSGAVLSRGATVGESRETLRATISALSVLDLIPENSKPERLPHSPVPFFERQITRRKKPREIKMLYLDRNPSAASIDIELERKSLSLPPSAMSVYTPDLESTSGRQNPITIETLQENCPVIVPKWNSTLWRNPAINPPTTVLPHPRIK